MILHVGVFRWQRGMVTVEKEVVMATLGCAPKVTSNELRSMGATVWSFTFTHPWLPPESDE